MESRESYAARKDRVAGCLVGVAVGDALGAPLEFHSRREIRNRFPHGLREMIASPQRQKGEYTDDTQMALLIAESLLDQKSFAPLDLAMRFELWARTAPDVGLQTRAVVAMARYLQHPEDCAARYHADRPHDSAGNGALMRCAPVALFCLHSLEQLVELSRATSRVTHCDPKAQSSCVLLNAWIRAMIMDNVRDARSQGFALIKDSERFPWQRLMEIELYKEEDIASTGYTVHTLEAAAWSFLTTDSFEEAVVRAACLGDDADTTAAVCGALAGAYYGCDAIPLTWRNDLQNERRIRELALALASHDEERLR
jgi:ADP-ribosyl-[dinitrogen reductase] hydrolase